jgi:type I restriction enzyme, R subunit
MAARERARFTESVVEDTALAWLESLGYAVKHGPDITPSGETLTLAQWERESYSQVVLADKG